CVEHRALQPSDAESRSHGREAAGRRAQGAHFQGERRASGSVSMAKDKDHKAEAKGKSEQKAPQKTAQPQAKAQPKKEPNAAPAPKADEPKIPAPPARLAVYYREKGVRELTQKCGYKSAMQVPRLRQITLNIG